MDIFHNQLTDVVNRILFLATKDKVTYSQLCDIIDSNRNKISDWKRGKSTPKYDEIVKIAEYFNVSTDYLLGITDNPVLNKTKVTEEEKIAAKIFTLTADQRRNVEKYIDFIQTQ